MGSLLIGPPTSNIYPGDFKIEENMCICEQDLSDFTEKIEFYVENDEKRFGIVSLAMQRWDDVMSPQNLSRYWLDTSIDYIGYIGKT